MKAQDIEGWVEQCRNGQARIYAKVVQALQPGILEFLYRMTHNRELAEDLGQEAFLRAYRHLDRYDRNKSAFSTWLFTLARNLCLDELRKKRPITVPFEEAVVDSRLPGPDPRLAVHEDDLERKIAEAVQSLEPAFREAFILKEYHGLSLEEMAEVTGCPEGTVKSRLYRARLMLQDLLKPVLEASV